MGHLPSFDVREGLVLPRVNVVGMVKPRFANFSDERGWVGARLNPWSDQTMAFRSSLVLFLLLNSPARSFRWLIPELITGWAIFCRKLLSAVISGQAPPNRCLGGSTWLLRGGKAKD